MTNISKRKLTEVQEVGLFEQLSKVFAGKNESEISALLGELLGREERIMLAKRFAAILLIHHKQTPYFIGQTLSLSPTTVGTLLERYDRGEYKALVKIYKKPTQTFFEIMDTIDDLLHLGGLLPRYKGYNNKKC